MAVSATPDPVLSRISDRIAQTMGLHFPPERWSDLQRGLARAAVELGFADEAACAQWLVSATPTKAQWQVIAGELTIGETYFFRDRMTFDVVANRVLPELVQQRRNTERRLRLWSAACCTGEEAYSLAILLSQVIPDIKDWHVTILATDINERFLRKAAAGVYSEWSFRDTPPEFKARYFERTPDGRYAILPEIKQRVTFAQMNLVEDVFPSLTTDTNAMDIVFCRNVLMYFTHPQLRKVIGNLRRSLLEGGWLAVSPSEVSQQWFASFKTESFPGVFLYRKGGGLEPSVPAWTPPAFEPPPYFAPRPAVEVPLPSTPPEPPPAVPAASSVELEPPPPRAEVAARLYEEGYFAEAADTLLYAQPPPSGALEFSLLARALANQGQLSEARAWCDRWLAADKLDASAHYLRAVILQELGEHDAAGQALQRAVYLRPEQVLAHFALGNLARSTGSSTEAGRHFRNALRLLKSQPPDEPLPESDGLTAGRLTEIITSLVALEATP